MEDSVESAFERVKEKGRLHHLEKKLEVLYDHIMQLYTDGKLLNTYFGNDNKFNGYIQKADIYALAVTIYESLYYYGRIDVKKDVKLYDLLINMLNINPDKRYSVSQCLSHPYFRKKTG